jgi:release factor glutamine methyltransferase
MKVFYNRHDDQQAQMVTSGQTYREALYRASSLLEEQYGSRNGGQCNPQIARWLLLTLLDVSPEQLIWKLDEEMPADHRRTYNGWLKRVLDGEPYQHIVGAEDFFGRTFKVNSDVLIPRPETEALVRIVLDLLPGFVRDDQAQVKQSSLRPKQFFSQQFIQPLQQATQSTQHAKSADKADGTNGTLASVDVGTGSGIIAITLALENAKLSVQAVDISERALQVARENARNHGAQVQFALSDGLQRLIDDNERVRIIVSNPPYVSEQERSSLSATVIDYEPHTALFAADDGLHMYKQLVRQSRSVFAYPALLAFEVGTGQASAVRNIILGTYPQATCRIHRDMRGIERIVTAYICC